RDESANACRWKSFVISKEHCRRPHVPSSLEISATVTLWLERTPDKREVGGSTPPRPTSNMVRGFSSAGRAVALQASGHRFDPDKLH
ncbi:unnamed protein product, partial [Phaeothamnion confervicola]